MKKLIFCSLFFLFSIALAQSKKGDVKKIVKIIEFEKGGHGSSWSSEEFRRRRRPKSTSTKRPQNDVKKGACDDGWMEFQRPSGPWCVLVDNNKQVTDGQLSYSAAQSLCREHGAVLTGLQNAKERMKIADEALRQIKSYGQKFAGVWLGAEALPDCKVKSCNPQKTFKWTDGQTTGVEGFKWGKFEPDDLDYGTPCLQMFVRSPGNDLHPGEPTWWKGVFEHGDLDKFKCDVPTKPLTRLYACGKVGRK